MFKNLDLKSAGFGNFELTSMNAIQRVYNMMIIFYECCRVNVVASLNRNYIIQ